METAAVIALLIGVIAYLAWAVRKSEDLVTPGQGIYEMIPGAKTIINGGITVTLDDLYESHGRQKGLDPILLKAIAIVESSENPNAKNPSDPSYGLMQILCQPDGQGGCKNRLNVLDWPPQSSERLYDADYSLHIGSQILRWNIDQYGFNKGIAVYNSWTAHNDPQNGPFCNQVYVDNVLKNYYNLTGVMSI